MATNLMVRSGSRDGCQTLVHSPPQDGFGRQVWGRVIRVRSDRYDAFAHGSPNAGRRDVGLGSFPSEAGAIREVEGWARRTLTAEALAATFEAVTGGGMAVTFLRRSPEGIIGVIDEGGQRVLTSWGEDGLCNLFRCPATPEEHELQSRFRLVWRQHRPAIDNDSTAALSGMRA